MNKKILILGGSGMVGSCLIKLLELNNIVYSTYFHNKFKNSSFKINIESEQELENIFNKTNPDIVINLCGIYKNLDFCEKNKELVMNVNGNVLKPISVLANKFNSFLITISTDQVFDGKDGNYNEISDICPINYYGKTKAEAEKLVQKIAKKYCIVRTSLIWGKNKVRDTFSEFILNEIKHGKEIQLIDDQTTTPTYLENFCNMLCEVVEKEITGIIHLAGPTKLSRYEFGQKLLECCKMNREKIIPVKRTEFIFGKYMPSDTSLNTDKACKMLSVNPEKIERSLQKYVKQD